MITQIFSCFVVIDSLTEIIIKKSEENITVESITQRINFINGKTILKFSTPEGLQND